MIAKERLPALRGRLSFLGHVLSNGRLGEVVAEQVQLGLNAWRAPGRVLLRHASDESLNGIRHRRASWITATGLPASEEPKAGAMPTDDGLRFDDGKGRLPAIPELGEPDPNHRSRHCSLGLGFSRSRIASCCRRARFSAASAARETKNTRRNRPKALRMLMGGASRINAGNSREK